jgi:hypothetical protein
VFAAVAPSAVQKYISQSTVSCRVQVALIKEKNQDNSCFENVRMYVFSEEQRHLFLACRFLKEAYKKYTGGVLLLFKNIEYFFVSSSIIFTKTSDSAKAQDYINPEGVSGRKINRKTDSKAF